jgi:hypothetical protein
VTEDKLADKIAKLLRQAEGTDVEAEAQVFTAHAAALMVKHGIDQARVEALMAPDDARREEIKTVAIKLTGSYRLALRRIAFCVVSGLGTCREFYVSHRNHDMFYVIGHASDVDAAMVLITSIGMQSSDALKRWWVGERLWYDTPQEKFRARRQFLISFGEGVWERLVRQRKASMAEAEAAEPGTALAVVDRATHLDAHMAEQHSDVRAARPSRMIGDGNARVAGRQAGRLARVNTAEVGAGRPQIQS